MARKFMKALRLASINADVCRMNGQKPRRFDEAMLRVYAVMESYITAL